MKIGILTYHRSHNFGALFQAIASRRYLESLGHETYHIDYWPEYHRAMYTPFSLWYFKRLNYKGKIYYIWQCIKRLSGNMQRKGRYDSFIAKYIKPHCAPKDVAFDAIIYGSDQIWRKQPYINDYNPVYFAHNNYQTKKHIALSASAGVLPQTDQERERFKSLLDHFDSISVREESLKGMVESFGYKAKLTCDPALLLTSKQWDEVFPRKEFKGDKYLLLVNYIENSFCYDEVKALADSLGLKMICINGSAILHHRTGDLRNVGPEELFNYVRNAEFVCTSSFHALVFSILYHKQVFAAFSKNAQRGESFLKELKIGHCLLEPEASIPHDIKSINFNNVDLLLERFKEDTLNYIQLAISE